jgi:hypothetical protein
MSIYMWFCYHTQFWLKPEDRTTYSELMFNFYHNSKVLTILFLITLGYTSGKLTNIRFLDCVYIFAGALIAHLFWNFHKKHKKVKVK